MLKALLLGKIKFTKKALFFLWRAPTHHSRTFDSQFSYELKHIIYLSKTDCVWGFLFSIPSLYFYSTKNMDSLTLNCHNSFQNEKNRKATHSFAPRPMIFKLQKEVWKFSDICLSWSSLKTDLETSFLNF